MNANHARDRMICRLLRLDEDTTEEEEETPEHVSHGNTRLPFGLCERHHIALPKKATPRQAWEALEGKTGITAHETYEHVRKTGTVKDMEPKQPEPEEPEAQISPHNLTPTMKKKFNNCPYRLYKMHDTDSFPLNRKTVNDGLLAAFKSNNLDDYTKLAKKALSDIKNGQIIHPMCTPSDRVNYDYIKIGNNKYERILAIEAYDGGERYKDSDSIHADKCIFTAEEVAKDLHDRFQACDSKSKDWVLNQAKMMITLSREGGKGAFTLYESAQWKSQFSSSKEEQEKAKKQQQKEEAKREALINSLHTERATPGLLKSNFDKTSTATKESIAKDMLNKHGYILDLHDTYPNGTIDTLDDYKAIYDAVDTVTSFFGNIALEHFNSSQVLQNPDGSYNYNAIAWCSMYPWKRAGLTLRGWPDNDYKQRQANYGYYKKCKDKIAAGTANSTDKEDGRFSRWTVEVAGRNPTLSVIMHEMLHAAKHTILGHDYDDVIKEVMDYAISRGDDAKYISQYSTHRETDKNTGELLAPNFEEFYVESAMAYLNGEKLPQYIRDMVELPIKVRNGEIKKEDLVWGCSTYPKKTKKSGGNKQ